MEDTRNDERSKDACQMRSLMDHFLIAMPSMGDPNFNETVTYVCRHDEDGAIGIIVNRPTDMRLEQIFEQLSLEVTARAQALEPVFSGGPVTPDRGFVLHRSEATFEATFEPAGLVRVTVSQDVLVQMAAGRGPEPALVALGYAGWDAGQLESELAANAWLSVPADPAVIFDTPYEQRWSAAAGLLGVDIHQLTSYAGHA